MSENNIRLYEAMTKAINCRIRVWEVYGLHIDVEGLPKNAKVRKTFVFKRFDDPWQVGIEYTVKGSPQPEKDATDECSTLEELKKKYPQLFELEGDLYALS